MTVLIVLWLSCEFPLLAIEQLNLDRRHRQAQSAEEAAKFTFTNELSSTVECVKNNGTSVIIYAQIGFAQSPQIAAGCAAVFVAILGISGLALSTRDV